MFLADFGRKRLGKSIGKYKLETAGSPPTVTWSCDARLFDALGVLLEPGAYAAQWLPTGTVHVELLPSSSKAKEPIIIATSARVLPDAAAYLLPAGSRLSFRADGAMFSGTVDSLLPDGRYLVREDGAGTDLRLHKVDPRPQNSIPLSDTGKYRVGQRLLLWNPGPGKWVDAKVAKIPLAVEGSSYVVTIFPKDVKLDLLRSNHAVMPGSHTAAKFSNDCFALIEALADPSKVRMTAPWRRACARGAPTNGWLIHGPVCCLPRRCLLIP